MITRLNGIPEVNKMRVTEKFLKPSSPDLIVRDPGNFKLILPVDGAVKPWVGPQGRYWRRRVNDGTVLVSQPKKEVSQPVPQRKRTSKEDR